MKIRQIVDQALRQGYLTSAMEEELSLASNHTQELTAEQWAALGELHEATEKGKVLTLPRKRFRNVMEGLVEDEIMSRLAALEPGWDPGLDVGDMAAYALNRLPPLYATSAEGAKHQREHANKELRDIIGALAGEAMEKALARPRFFPDREPVLTGVDLLRRLESLLKAYADQRVLDEPGGGVV